MNQTIKILNKGGIGVLATDTIYGLVGSALNKKAVERVYKTRKRSPNKPCIILISSLKDLEKFDIKLDAQTTKVLTKLWGVRSPTSNILPLPSTTLGVNPQSKFKYLHRGTNTLAFRLLKNTKRNKDLINILQKTGPLVAPSANLEGEAPATTIKQAKAYFGDSVDFYVAGRTSKKPSKIIKIIEHPMSNKIEVEVLRP